MPTLCDELWSLIFGFLDLKSHVNAGSSSSWLQRVGHRRSSWSKQVKVAHKHVQKYPQIQALHLLDFGLSWPFYALTSLCHLQSLTIQQVTFDVSVKDGVLWKSLARLRHLDLGGCRCIPLCLLQTCASCLETLNLNFADIQVGVENLIAQMTNLQDLSLAGCQLQNLQFIQDSLSGLRKLNVSINFDLTTESFKADIFKNVRFLNVENCLQIQKLPGHLKSLETLVCSNIPSLRFDSLHTFGHLQHLKVNLCVMFQDQELGVLLIACPLLRTLSAQECVHITDQGLFIIARYKHLDHLDLTGCPQVSRHAKLWFKIQRKHTMKQIWF